MLNSLFPHFDSYESPFSPIKFKIFGKTLSVTDIKRNRLTRNFDSGNFTSKLGCLNICNEKYHLELHKTWLNITRSIQDIEKDLKRIRQGFVTLSKVPKEISVRMHNIDNALTGIQSAIRLQQKVTPFQYPLGDILDGKKVGLKSG